MVCTQNIVGDIVCETLVLLCRKDIIGVILVKELALVDPDDAVPVTSLRLRPIPFLPAHTKMYDLLHLFQVLPLSV